MKIINMSDMIGGWFIGDFEPTVFKTDQFEVCYKQHYKGEVWDNHYHKVATEINYLIRGEMKINDTLLSQGDIFLIEPLGFFEVKTGTRLVDFVDREGLHELVKCENLLVGSGVPA